MTTSVPRLAVVLAALLTLMVGARCRPMPERMPRTSCRVRNSRGTVASRWMYSIRTLSTAVGIAFLVAFAAGPVPAIAVAVGITMKPRLRRIRQTRRTAAQVIVAYPDFVDLLVVGIKAGCSPRLALGAVESVCSPSIRPAVSAVLRRADMGHRFNEAVGALGEVPPLGLGPIARSLIDALALADRYGTPLAPVLDRLAGEARAQRRRNADAAARRLPVQLSFPLVGCTLPSFVLLTIVPLMAGTFSSLRGLTP